MGKATIAAAEMLSNGMVDARLTNDGLGRLLGVRPSMVSMMRTGTMDIPVCRAAQIAGLLGIEAALLVDACIRSYPGSRTWQAYALGIADMQARMAA